MPVAYVTTPGASITASGRTLIVRVEGQSLVRIKLLDLDRLVVAGGVNLTTPALRLLLREGVPTAFVTQRGQFVGSLQPAGSLQASRLQSQYAVCADRAGRLRLSKRTVAQKFAAMSQLLQRFLSNHRVAEVVTAHTELVALGKSLRDAKWLPALRGMEGRAAVVYWNGYRHLLRGELTFGSRTTRPPRDPVSALLSYGYAVLATEIGQWIETFGYDPHVGVYHERRPGRPALALDLMEPMRHELVDRLVQRIVNLRRLNDKDFRPGPNGGVWLAPAAAKRYVGWYEELMAGRFERGQNNVAHTVRDRLRQSVGDELRAMFGPVDRSPHLLSSKNLPALTPGVFAHGT